MNPAYASEGTTIPSKKNRGGEGKSEKPWSLHGDMHLPGGAYGPPHNSKDYTFRNIMDGASKGGNSKRKAAIETKAGYDVATRMNVPSAKGMGKGGRTMKKTKVK